MTQHAKTALSVNVNKVALLRNSRHLGIPSVLKAAQMCLEAGAQGITIHPRPDERHIRASDVIDFNNQFFQFLSEEFTNEAYQKLYKETAGQETNEKTGGFVSVTFLDDTIEINEEIAEDESITEKDKQYLSKTLEIIQQSLENGFDYSDIVLLTRKTKNGVLLANFLTENNIPIISSETLLIQNASEVKFIINFLEYLIH